MANIKKSLRKLHKSLQSFIDFVIGREEQGTEKTALPTQRNQYFT